ncbi:MAG: DNA-3-methyladenine glycosylase I [Gammaproteobacteria bacterium]
MPRAKAPLVSVPAARTRCAWPKSDPLMIDYHDHEWGVPLHDDQKLFEFLILEGAQAGLSWLTVLRKRENFRRAFDHFDPRKVARYGEPRIAKLMQDPGIIRNRKKIEAAVSNARAFLRLQEEYGSFDRYVWGFVGGRPLQNHWRSLGELPARNAVSDALSHDLKQRGFKFIGSTVCYAHMQATGMVNDHLVSCFRYRALRPAG